MLQTNTLACVINLNGELLRDHTLDEQAEFEIGD